MHVLEFVYIPKANITLTCCQDLSKEFFIKYSMYYSHSCAITTDAEHDLLIQKKKIKDACFSLHAD